MMNFGRLMTVFLASIFSLIVPLTSRTKIKFGPCRG